MRLTKDGQVKELENPEVIARWKKRGWKEEVSPLKGLKPTKYGFFQRWFK